MLWSAGFSVFKLKWKMNGVLIDGECMWLMECVLEMDSVRVWCIFFFFIIFTTLVVFIIWCLFILYVMLYLEGITLVNHYKHNKILNNTQSD